MKFTTVRTLGFVTIVAAIITAVVLFGLVRKELEDIRDHWQENLLWNSTQLEIESVRFREALSVFALGAGQIDTKEINKRFDILWSRVALFQAGRPGFTIETRPNLSGTLADLMATLKEQEARVTGLADDAFSEAAELRAIFLKHDRAIRGFNRIVMRNEMNFDRDLRNSLYAEYQTLTWLGSGALLVSLALIAFFAAETQRQKRIAQANLKLLEQARLASCAKTAFLSMMSHGLRTPMNGILGMIALARQYAADSRQAEHLDQAAESSKQMNDLLHDLLDFASLEANTFDPVAEPFELVDLEQKLVVALAPYIRREGLHVTVNVVSGPHTVLVGDSGRLSQVILHLARFLGQNAQQKPLLLDISYANGFFRAEFLFLYGDTTGVWQPEIVLGPTQQNNGNFANDALGPAIARGFVENMGGTLTLRVPEGDQDMAVVVLSVPLEIHEKPEVVVRIETQSIALEAICKSALNMPHVSFYQNGDSGKVDVVVVETGGAFEQETFDALRKQYPIAKFVALGAPSEEGRFVDEIKLPLNVLELRGASFLQSHA